MTYIRKELIIPKEIWEQGDNPQWSGEINKKNVEIFYDDGASSGSVVNLYAVFTESGFHGWLEFGFSMSEILQIVKHKPKDYNKSFEKLDEL